MLQQRRGRVLALDVATVTGFAVGNVGEKPQIGSIRFGAVNCSPVESWAAATTWISEFIEVDRPDLLLLEAPLAPSFARGTTNVNTARKLMGLSCLMETIPHMLGVNRIREARVQSIRKHFIGNGGLRSADAKRAVIQMCRHRGLEPRNDNEADAAALWYFGTETLLIGA